VSFDPGGVCVIDQTRTTNCDWTIMSIADVVRLNCSTIVSLAAAALVSVFATSAIAQSVTERLRGCLTIEDMTKARLDCYDEIVPPVIEDCRLVKQDEQRLTCFNRFLALPVKPAASETVPATPRPVASNAQLPVKKSKGCSLPGLHRLPDGKCTSRKN
jgi:hypothetical protein